MKRQLCFEDTLNKKIKMAQVPEIDFEFNRSITVASGDDVTQSLERHFNYKLSDKKAKSNFLKSAARETFEIEEKGICTMLSFSVGAYYEVVLPTVAKWVAGDRTLDCGVIVGEVLPSYDENEKHVETIIKMVKNGVKITVTFYNTTQRVKIEGRGYYDFGGKFLIPLFKNKIESTPPGRIEKYNKDVIAALSGKRKVVSVSRPVRSVRYKSTSKLPCSKCEITFLNNSQLSKHKKTKHSSPVSDTNMSIKCMPLVDDLSLIDMTDSVNDNEEIEEVTMEEISPPQIVAVQVEEKQREKTFKCEECEYSTLVYTELENHKKSKVIKVPEDLAADTCENPKPLDHIEELSDMLRDSKGQVPQELVNHTLDDHSNGNLETEKEDDPPQMHLQTVHVYEDENQENDTENKLTANSVFQCLKCNYTCDSEGDLKIHTQTIHEDVRVNIQIEQKLRKIKCSKCEYECRYNKQLEKHIKDKHVDEDHTRIYKCDTCDYRTAYVGQLWEHVLIHHPNKNEEFSPISKKDAIINLLAEQNMGLMEEVVNLRKGMKGSFEQLAEDFGKTLNEMHERAEERDFENKEMIKKLTEKVQQFENNSKNAFIALSNNVPSTQGPPTVKACSKPVVPEPQTAPYPEPLPKASIQQRKKSKYLQKPKVLFIADSVGRNVEFRKVEKASNVRITTKKAYSSVKNKNARWPELNVTDVTRKEVNNVAHGDNYDVLVLSAPTVDITNLDTMNFKASENLEFFKQEVLISSKNMISAGENAIRMNPGLKKVIILCHPPRFDTSEVDPLMLKQTLAKIANKTRSK